MAPSTFTTTPPSLMPTPPASIPVPPPMLPPPAPDPLLPPAPLLPAVPPSGQKRISHEQVPSACVAQTGPASEPYAHRKFATSGRDPVHSHVPPSPVPPPMGMT